MTLPDEVTLCLNSISKEHAIKQLNGVDFKKLPFRINLYFVADKYPELVNSFSQMINDAVDDTDDEFMVFANPKSNITEDYLLDMVEKLCNGYSLVAFYSLGYFATTKQLFREVGMLDERFIGGEFEDDDFLLRLKMHGKKIQWEENKTKYQISASYCPPLRGASYTVFWKKWRTDNENMRPITHHYIKAYDSHRRISVRHSKARYDIHESWLDSSESHGFGNTWSRRYEGKLSYSLQGANENKRIERIRFIINVNKTYARFEFLSDVSSALSFVILNSETKIQLQQRLIRNNMWIIADYEDYELENFELRVYHDGSLIYLNNEKTEFIKEIELNLTCSLIDNEIQN